MSETTGPRPARSDGSGRPEAATTQALPVTTAGRERTEGPEQGRPGGSRTDGPRTDGPRSDGPRADGPRTDGPRTDGPRTDGPRTDTGRPVGDRRPTVPRPGPARPDSRPVGGARAARPRRARLALRRIEPWSVFLFSFLGSIGLGVVLLVAVAALYTMLSALGVIDSVNDLVSEIDPGGGPDSAPGAPVLSLDRALAVTGLLAAVNIVALTALATLGALLYNVCASFTGGLELTLSEKD